MEPMLRLRREDRRDLPLLCWRFDEPRLVCASAPHGGGLGPRRWIVNATVPASYGRRDPDHHLGKLGVSLGLRGRGVGMLTAVDVAEVRSADDGGVHVAATVGTGQPQWAAADPGERAADRQAGTINVVAFFPERLTEAALVNAIATATEAKSQAMLEAGLAGTGTATDAVCLVCPTDGRIHHFGGPRSVWGARLARAVHRAVVDGIGAAPLPAPGSSPSGGST